ncbi:MAG: ATP-binding protein [Formosimonas sp.]
MNPELLNHTLTQLSDTLARANLLLPSTAQDVDWSAHAYLWQVRHGRGFLEGLKDPRLQNLDELQSIDRQKNAVLQNTLQFIHKLPANHVLLTGARGTGKSSLVRACLAEYAAQGLRVIEVEKDHLGDLPQIVDLIRHRPERFIVFCDDLAFEAQDSGYKSLKTVLDGSFNGYAENVLVYATSNRRHLLPEYDSDNVGYSHPSDSELHPSETVEEKIALSERFGLWLSFYPFKQNDYLSIVDAALSRFGWVASSDDDAADMRAAALQFTLERGSRSARVAQHFARQWAGAAALAKT